MKTRHLLMVVGMLAVCSMLGQGAVARTLQLIRSIDFPYEHSYGSDLAWDGQYLWTSKALGGGPAITFAIDPSDGSVVRWFEFAGAGITWDGAHLWITNTTTPLVGDDAPDFIEKFSRDGTLVSSVLLGDSPSAQHSGAAWDGAYLWLSDEKNSRISQVNPSDGSIVKSFSSPGSNPLDLEWVDGSLWNIDGADNMIYQIDTSGNILETWSAPVGKPYGIAYDGQYFWVLDNTFENVKLVQLVVPEPSAIALLVTGVLSGLYLLWRRGADRDFTPGGF